MTWTIQSLLNWSADFFTKKKFDTPRLESEILLAHALHLDRLSLFLQFDRPMAEAELKRYKQLIERRLTREPIQHITQKTFFMSLEFHVEPGVFIPRPETELLVEKTIDLSKEYFKGGTDRETTIHFADIGTGSGCVAISLAKYLPHAKGIGIDLSEKALSIAQENAMRHHVTERVSFSQGDGLETLSSYSPSTLFHFIVSNPPYISQKETHKMDPETNFEPKEALFSGEEGLNFIQMLLNQSPPFLRENGFLLFEIGEGQEEAIRHLTKNHPFFHPPTLFQDLNRIPRVVSLQKKG